MTASQSREAKSQKQIVIVFADLCTSRHTGSFKRKEMLKIACTGVQGKRHVGTQSTMHCFERLCTELACKSQPSLEDPQGNQLWQTSSDVLARTGHTCSTEFTGARAARFLSVILQISGAGIRSNHKVLALIFSSLLKLTAEHCAGISVSIS